MATYWILTAALFVLGLLLGYVGRVLMAQGQPLAEIHPETQLQTELEEDESLNTTAAILRNLNRNSSR